MTWPAECCLVCGRTLFVGMRMALMIAVLRQFPYTHHVECGVYLQRTAHLQPA